MKLLSSTMIWTGDIFSLYSDQVLLDHGVSAQRDLIRHPGGAAILLMRDEQILLVRQYRHGRRTNTAGNSGRQAGKR